MDLDPKAMEVTVIKAIMDISAITGIIVSRPSGTFRSSLASRYQGHHGHSVHHWHHGIKAITDITVNHVYFGLQDIMGILVITEITVSRLSGHPNPHNIKTIMNILVNHGHQSIQAILAIPVITDITVSSQSWTFQS